MNGLIISMLKLREGSNVRTLDVCTAINDHLIASHPCTNLEIPYQEKVALLPIPVSTNPRPDPKLSRTIAVAGSIAAPDDFVDLWRGLSSVQSERFALVWETQELIDLTNSIMNMLVNQASCPT